MCKRKVVLCGIYLSNILYNLSRDVEAEYMNEEWRQHNEPHMGATHYCIVHVCPNWPNFINRCTIITQSCPLPLLCYIVAYLLFF